MSAEKVHFIYPQNIIPTVKPDDESITIWGGFSSRSMDTLNVIEGTMDIAMYVKY